MFRTHIFLISLMLSGSALAATSVPTSSADDHHLVIGLSAGPTWINGNKTQAINLQSDISKTYTGSNPNNPVPQVELFGGWQKSLFVANQPLVGQLGISVVDAGYAKLSGDVWEDNDPTFNNFNYTYKVNHAHVAIKGRLIGNYNTLLQPYLSASAGVGFNRAYDFSIYPTTSGEVPPPGFQSNTTSTFTYTLGIGLQMSITPQLQAAVGYEFADWGKVQLSRAPGQTTGQGLSLDHLYGNQLLLSLFYVI